MMTNRVLSQFDRPYVTYSLLVVFSSFYLQGLKGWNSEEGGEDKASVGGVADVASCHRRGVVLKGRGLVGANRNLPREMPAGEGQGGGRLLLLVLWSGPAFFVLCTLIPFLFSTLSRFATLARAIPR